MLPLIIPYSIKKMGLHNVSIYRFFFYQNQLINKYARNEKAKIPESLSYIVRCRRTYILKKDLSNLG